MTGYEEYLLKYLTPQPIHPGLCDPGVVIEKTYARGVLANLRNGPRCAWKYLDGGPFEYHVRVLRKFGAIECDPSGIPRTLTERGSELLKKVEESIYLDRVERVTSLWGIIMLLDMDTGSVSG